MVDKFIFRYVCFLLVISVVSLQPVNMVTAQTSDNVIVQISDDGDRFTDEYVNNVSGYESDHHLVGWYVLTSSGTIVPLTWTSDSALETLFTTAISKWYNAGLRPDITFQKVSSDPLLQVQVSQYNTSCGGAPACTGVTEYTLDTSRNMRYWYKA